MNTILLEKFNTIKLHARWKDWAIDKIPVLFGICFYLILTNDRISLKNIYDFYMFLIFSISSTIYGYSINDFADVEIDKIHGKRNIFITLPNNKKIAILTIIILTMILSGFYFVGKPYFIVLWFSQLLVATFYSMPPIRFKERGIIGLIIPFFAQLVLPTLICFSIFGDLFSSVCYLFLIYSVFKGGAYDIGHQFHDYNFDSTTQTKTFAVKHGAHIALYLFRIFLILERFSFFFILWFIKDNIIINYHEIDLHPIYFMILLDVILIVSVAIQEIKRKSIIDPYFEDIRGLSNILHVIFPNIIFPFLILFVLSMEDISYFLLFAFFFIWVFPTPQKIMWPLRTCWQAAKRIILIR